MSHWQLQIKLTISLFYLHTHQVYSIIFFSNFSMFLWLIHHIPLRIHFFQLGFLAVNWRYPRLKWKCIYQLRKLQEKEQARRISLHSQYQIDTVCKSDQKLLFYVHSLFKKLSTGQVNNWDTVLTLEVLCQCDFVYFSLFFKLILTCFFSLHNYHENFQRFQWNLILRH